MDVREIEDLKLPCDNTSLRKEKDRLQSEFELAKCTISKLEAKINELQNEKSSLTTVIKILHA
jgi:predicted  nucleic acid-binding Zn-ribbon protein